MRSGSTHVGAAVVLTTATPAHAAGDGQAEMRPRADTLPARHRLGARDTGNSLSERYYDSRGGALAILWSNELKRWPPSKRIVASGRFRLGDTIVIPKPLKASINPPQRATQASTRDGHEAVASRRRGP
jgi:hypothetical protein